MIKVTSVSGLGVRCWCTVQTRFYANEKKFFANFVFAQSFRSDWLRRLLQCMKASSVREPWDSASCMVSDTTRHVNAASYYLDNKEVTNILVNSVFYTPFSSTHALTLF